MKRWFVAIVALQLAFTVGEAAMYNVRAVTGKKVVLKVLPVDPRSLFMGQYMALSFDISRLDQRTLGAPLPQVAYGDTVYVGVQPGRPYARAVSVTPQRPRPGRPGVVYIRGRVGYNPMGSMTVNYGIERYYFPEQRQEELMDMLTWRNGRMPDITARVSVDSTGQAFLRGLAINGRNVDF